MNFDPRLIALFCIMFIALGIFSILTGRRRLRESRVNNPRMPWYRQISILTGIEYILLAVAFLLNIGISYGWLPKNTNGFILPFYLLILIASAVLAGVVIYQGITNNRRRQAAIAVPRTETSFTSSVASDDDLDPEGHSRQAQQRRERRQKAAQARRRRAGKA